MKNKISNLKIVCLDAATLGEDLDLGAIFGDLGDFESFLETAPQDSLERVKDADIVITNKVLITREIINNSNLKLICVSATGVNNIDLEAAKEANIPVRNVAGYSTSSVAQQTWASILALTNHVRYYAGYAVSETGWRKCELFTHIGREIKEIEDKSFCVVGLGAIGQKVAQIAKVFGCEVSYYSTSGAHESAEFRRVSWEEALKNDIISIHAPLNDRTNALFDKTAVFALKPGAILTNFGRGGIVDELAVAQAIDEERIFYAADVVGSEPIAPNHPFLHLAHPERLLLTPHCAWGAVEARKRLLAQIRQNILDFLAANA